VATATPTDRGELWRELKQARQAGASLDVLDDKTFVEWTVPELQTIYENVFGEPEQYEGVGFSEATPTPMPEPFNIPTAPPVFEHPQPRRVDGPLINQGMNQTPHDPECPASQVCGRIKFHHLEWAQYRPADLAALLGVPLDDRGADRAGLTLNTHDAKIDPVRVDFLGRVWYLDEIMKSAIPQPRMVRKTKSISNNVEVVKTKRPDGGLDETFEVAGQQKHEIEIRTTMPSYQVGVYRDPRFPFRIHQYGGRRGFDYEEVRDFYGGLDLIPTTLKEKTTYIGMDLCFDLNATRDQIERAYREEVLGRSTYNER
jgi:hypothetical protein